MSSADKVILSCALTGAVTTKKHCPAIPYTPVEIADEAKRAYDAGAAIVHIHARTDDGLPYIGPHRNYPHHLFVFGDSSHSVTGSFLASRILLRHHFGEMDPADEAFGFHR